MVFIVGKLYEQLRNDFLPGIPFKSGDVAIMKAFVTYTQVHVTFI